MRSHFFHIQHIIYIRLIVNQTVHLYILHGVTELKTEEAGPIAGPPSLRYQKPALCTSSSQTSTVPSPRVTEKANESLIPQCLFYPDSSGCT